MSCRHGIGGDCPYCRDSEDDWDTWTVSSDPAKRGTWWVLHEDDLQKMLQEVAAGSDPSAVLIEHYVNCEHYPT